MFLTIHGYGALHRTYTLSILTSPHVRLVSLCSLCLSLSLLSDAIYYTRYRDCGGGVLEITSAMHNAKNAGGGGDTLSYLNVPWGGVRTSSLKDVLHAPKGGGDAKLLAGPHGWGTTAEVAAIRKTNVMGGYTVFAQVG